MWLLESFILGWSVLISAIVLNIIATKLHLKTLYDFLRKRDETSLTSYIWMFVLYPFGLGISAYLALFLIV